MRIYYNKSSKHFSVIFSSYAHHIWHMFQLLGLCVTVKDCKEKVQPSTLQVQSSMFRAFVIYPNMHPCVCSMSGTNPNVYIVVYVCVVY